MTRDVQTDIPVVYWVPGVNIMSLVSHSLKFYKLERLEGVKKSRYTIFIMEKSSSKI